MNYRYYILVNKIPHPCDDISLYLKEDRKIERTTFGESEVSTVFLGFSHGHDKGKPILFETLVFGGEHDGYMLRYTSWDEAISGHEEVCIMINKVAIDRENKLNDLGL